jgi:hypothetical protein
MSFIVSSEVTLTRCGLMARFSAMLGRVACQNYFGQGCRQGKRYIGVAVGGGFVKTPRGAEAFGRSLGGIIA